MERLKMRSALSKAVEAAKNLKESDYVSRLEFPAGSPE